MDSIADPYYIAFGIGISQVLDEYARVSLDAQRLWNFPGSLVLSLETLKENLDEWKENFSWGQERLLLGGIGIPSIHINNLENGQFKQQLTQGMKQSAAVNLNLYHQLP